jgi:hypothetical protein
MLHLFTQFRKIGITQHPSLVSAHDCNCQYLLFPPNTAVNQPALGWFLFLISTIEKKMYFMLRFNQAVGRNVCAELAT